MLVLHNDAEYWCACLEFDALADCFESLTPDRVDRWSELGAAIGDYVLETGMYTRDHDGSRLSGD